MSNHGKQGNKTTQLSVESKSKVNVNAVARPGSTDLEVAGSSSGAGLYMLLICGIALVHVLNATQFMHCRSF